MITTVFNQYRVYEDEMALPSLQKYHHQIFDHICSTKIVKLWSWSQSCPEPHLGPGLIIYKIRSTVHHQPTNSFLPRVSTGVLNFRASLYRDRFQFFGPYWYLNFLKSPYFPKIYQNNAPRIQILSNKVTFAIENL